MAWFDMLWDAGVVLGGSGVQPHASLVMGHNYEGTNADITGNFPWGWNGVPLYTNNWPAQGQGIGGFNSGGRSYYVNSALGGTFGGAGKKFTIAAHYRSGAQVNQMVSILQSTPLQFAINGGGKLSLFNATIPWQVETTNAVIAPNTNYHIAVTYDQTVNSFAGVKLYVDGVLQAVTTTGTFDQFAVSGSQFDIGASIFTDHELYDLSVYNQALDAANITRIMNNFAPLP